MGCSPTDSFVRGISQARILEWVAISYSRQTSPPKDQTHISCIGRQILYHCAKSTILYVQIFGMGMEYRDSKERVWLPQSTKDKVNNSAELGPWSQYDQENIQSINWQQSWPSHKKREKNLNLNKLPKFRVTLNRSILF